MEPFSILQEQSDESLCALAASGDRVAEECLVTRYNRLVRACARPYFLAGGDSEDLIQEGMIGLLSAIRGFESGMETSFRTYAEVCIRNRLRSAMKAAARDKHIPLNTSVSLGNPLFDGNPESYAYGTNHQRAGENPEDLVIGWEERQRRMRILQDKLSGFERQVLDLYLDGFSYAKIAQRVGKSTKSVDNAVQRVRRKVAPFFSSGDFSVS
ncbi:MAG: sigma-70 family RNA polymerase sigma factor [Clostridiales bacterium]|nr:sigma-70 family RNA polymerase sigma factor [Clostridiales bacterium]